MTGSINRFVLGALALLAIGFFGAAPADAQAQKAPPGPKRVALVIGNGAYRENPLKNPVNDARAMAATLRQLGFQVIAREDATKPQMEQAVGEFGRALTKGAVALFYYAGHGMQVNGRNFLIPVDATVATEQSVRLETLDVDLVLDQVAAASSDVNLIILDACRNNPFERRFRGAGTGGLAQINAPKGTLIAYATAPGSVAADGDNGNGLYTSKLVEAIKTPGLPVEEVFKRVRAGVSLASNDAQTPWEASSLVGNFYFLGPTTVIVNQPAAKQQAVVPPPAPVPAPAAAPAPSGGAAFDGSWDTAVVCENTQDGAKGYTLRFYSKVTNGYLEGRYGGAEVGDGSSLLLSGQIKADGTALLMANGTTGKEIYVVGRLKPGSAYRYTAEAKFEGSKGSGRRNEIRACNLAFVKQ